MGKRLCVFVLFSACAAAQTVAGTVVDSVTGIGIPGVKVDVNLGSTANSSTTDAQGHFSFENLTDGTWTIFYSLRDYGSPRPARFQMKAGTPVKLEGRLTPQPRISGRVVTANSEPVPKAVIQLISPEAFWSMPADETGRFDLHQSLPPGQYRLSATAAPGFKPPKPGQGWGRTYYPGTLIPEGGANLALFPGADVRDIELKLLAVPTHAIRGICLNPDGSPAAKTKISLGQGRAYPPVSVEAAPDGSFEFPSVIDGEWQLSAELPGLRDTQWIELTGRDIEQMKLHLSAPFTITGKVVMETPQARAAPRPPQVRLGVRSPKVDMEMGVGSGGAAAKMEADGSFSVENVYPGVYKVNTGQPPKPYYLDSIRVGNAELTAPDVELGGPVSVTVLYKTNGGSVRGTVEGCSAGNIWLVPQEPGRRVQFFRFANCLEGGRYDIGAIRPGEYYVWSNPVEAISRGWIFGEFDEETLKRAAKVTVRAGEITALDFPGH